MHDEDNRWKYVRVSIPVEVMVARQLWSYHGSSIIPLREKEDRRQKSERKVVMEVPLRMGLPCY